MNPKFKYITEVSIVDEDEIHPIWFNFPEDMVLHVIRKAYYSGYPYDMNFEEPGYLKQYRALASVIPFHYTIIDFGCGFAPQCWYFRNHTQYVGIDTIDIDRCVLDNTYHYSCTIEYFLKYLAKDYLNETTFAICNFVDDKYTKQITEHFSKVFCYHPADTRLFANDQEITRRLELMQQHLHQIVEAGKELWPDNEDECLEVYEQV